MPASLAEAVDHVQHARGQQVGDQLGQHQDADRASLSAGLSTTQLPAPSAGASFQAAIRMGKFHGDDLADHAERLMEVVGDGVAVDLAQARLPAPARSRRSSGSGRPCQRDVGIQRFAHGLAVVHRLGISQQLECWPSMPVGDLEQDVGAGRRPSVAAHLAEAAWAASSAQLDVGRTRARGLGVDLAVDRRDHVEVLALHRRRRTRPLMKLS